jgi:peptidoglycan-N-acetylglucosamine deacetylase
MDDLSGAGRPAVTVVLSFDVDGMAGAVDPGRFDLAAAARGEFTVPAAGRILRLLGDRGLPATFFVPGQTAQAFPGLVARILEAGHEIGHHGYAHEDPATLSAAEEEAVLDRSIAALRDVAGITPGGYRAPCWRHTADTIRLLRDRGFSYDSSLMGHDVELYWCRTADTWSRTGPYQFGPPVDVVELPVAWHLDDFPMFEFVMDPAASVQGLASGSQVLEIWSDELAYAQQSLPGAVLTYTMHPEVIGRGHRMLMLQRFLDYACSLPGVEFRTAGAVVGAWRAAQPSKPA